MLITRLLLVLEVWDGKPTHTKSWARNFLMLDFTLGPSFKVKQWFTGFGELSFRWIQICIGLRCVGLSLFSCRVSPPPSHYRLPSNISLISGPILTMLGSHIPYFGSDWTIIGRFLSFLYQVAMIKLKFIRRQKPPFISLSVAFRAIKCIWR